MGTINKSDFDSDGFYPVSDDRLSTLRDSSFKVLGYEFDDNSGQLLVCVKLAIKEVINGDESIREKKIIPNYKGNDPEAMGEEEIPKDVILVIRFLEATNQSKKGNCD
nr:hypothetical protein [Allomuricauda sp.]